MESILDQKTVRELLEYDSSTGIFKWKKKRRGIKVDKPLGTDNGFGYLRITVLGKSYYAHRLAWLYEKGEFPENEIDHINGIKSDNRISNLRSLTTQQNAQNKIFPKSNNKSKTLGVSWHKKANKWQAHVCIYKQRKYLGLFNSIEDAHKAYLKEKSRIEYDNL